MSRAEELKKNAPAGSILATKTVDEIESLLKKAAAKDAADERTKYYGLRKRIHDGIMLAKAKAAGVEVTKAEVDAAMKAKGYAVK